MAKRKIIIWALFDSGNDCYIQAAQSFPDIEIYPIGIDIEKRNHHFIELDLADHGQAFGKNQIFDVLDKLPNPDVLGLYIPFDNPTLYGNYGYIVKKPTKFKSNIRLSLKYEDYYSGIEFNKVLRTYNARSNIPLELVKDIFLQIINQLGEFDA